MAKVKLEIDCVSKTYTSSKGELVEALRDVNLQVKDREFVALLGPTGCGKTTLLKLVAGLIKPTTGEIRLNKNKINGPGVDRGMVLQNYTLFPWLNVWDNIEFGLRLNGMPKEKRYELVEHYIRLIGLKEFENAYPSELSVGMQQRVAIARTMVTNPEILLMDEPFGALDTQTRSLMQELLLDVWEKDNKTVLFVTHDVEEAIFLADTIYVSTAQPGTIKAKIDVRIPRPRTFETKTSRRFLKLNKQLREMIREESIKAMQSRKRSEKTPARNLNVMEIFRTAIYNLI